MGFNEQPAELVHVDQSIIFRDFKLLEAHPDYAGVIERISVEDEEWCGEV